MILIVSFAGLQGIIILNFMIALVGDGFGRAGRTEEENRCLYLARYLYECETDPVINFCGSWDFMCDSENVS